MHFRRIFVFATIGWSATAAPTLTKTISRTLTTTVTRAVLKSTQTTPSEQPANLASFSRAGENRHFRKISTAPLAESTVVNRPPIFSHGSALDRTPATRPGRVSNKEPRQNLVDSGKRGLAYNYASMTGQFSVSEEAFKVNWAYNW
jgi:hypothetical protein